MFMYYPYNSEFIFFFNPSSVDLGINVLTCYKQVNKWVAVILYFESLKKF